MWEPVLFFGAIGLAKWLAFEWRLIKQPPRHLYLVLDALERQHPDSTIGLIQQQYR